MKFRLLERNYWGDHDVWKGKKLNYGVEIETPFRPKHEEFGKYSYTIRTPYNTIHNTYRTGQQFDSIGECIEFVESWILMDHKAR